MKRISLLLATAALTVAALGGAASADPGPTPNGLTGAANMTNTNALAGMLNAMSTNNAHGNAGMVCAVRITNGITAPGDCR